MSGFKIKTKEEMEIMAEAGRRLADILQTLKNEAKAGLETKYFDLRSLELIRKSGCEPAFLGYKPYGTAKPYPASICVSINEAIVHGLPSKYIIKKGDLVKLDLGLKYKGFYSDAAVTVGIGNIDFQKKKLIRAAEEAFKAGFNEVAAGQTSGDIGWAIEKSVKKNGFSVVEGLTGHGIGRELHEDPYIFNFGEKGQGEKLEIGAVFAIEPMISVGTSKIKQLGDDSFVTADGSLSAHWEHTVAVTENGARILTKI